MAVALSLSLKDDLYKDIETEMDRQDAIDKSALLWKRSKFYSHLLRLGLTVEMANQARKP